MNEKPITTLGPWSYHNPIDMAADEQSFSINKEVKWMNEIDKRIEKIEKGTPVYDCQGIIVCYTENDADKAWLIDQLKECREQLEDERGPRRNEALDEEAGNLIKDCYADLEKAMVNFRCNMNRALDLEYAAGQAQMEKEIIDDSEDIEQRTRRACFKAGWAWIRDDFGEQFGYDPTDDTDKEDFKQALYEAKIE